MNNQSTVQPVPNPQSPIPSPQSPKESWTPPVLRKTPIAETAGSKATAIGDGGDAYSS